MHLVKPAADNTIALRRNYNREAPRLAAQVGQGLLLLCVWTSKGFVHVALNVDVFSRFIVAWRISRNMKTDFVLDALERARYARQPDESGLIHRRDRESQYVSIRSSERFLQAGIDPLVGSTGDSYYNAFSELYNGLSTGRSTIALSPPITISKQ